MVRKPGKYAPPREFTMFGYLFTEDFSDCSGVHIGKLVIVSIFGQLHNQAMQAFLSDEVIFKCLRELFRGKLFIFEDELVYGGQRIGDIYHADCIYGVPESVWRGTIDTALSHPDTIREQ
jgi:hypothetical protein